MKGRKPKPLEARQLEGNLRKTRVSPPIKLGLVESKFPAPPAGLKDRGRHEWITTGSRLWKLKIMQTSDLPLFEAYCLEVDRYYQVKRTVNAQIEKYGTQALVTITEKGDMKPNPYLIIERHSLQKMQSLGAEFGLSPTARARLGLSKAAGAEDEDDVETKYFQRAKSRNSA